MKIIYRYYVCYDFGDDPMIFEVGYDDEHAANEKANELRSRVGGSSAESVHVRKMIAGRA